MTPLAGSLRTEFKIRSEAAHLARERHLRTLREERDRKERRDDQRDQLAADLADLGMMMVSASEIAIFRSQLDTYDTATIIALQENERALAEAQERLDAILLKAHVLPDGRRVFKTEDGTRVFDEFGSEVAGSVISPDEIADHRPRYEVFRSALDHKNDVVEERQDLIRYQGKLDNARERLDQGDITRGEYDRLQDDLKTSMPEAVRRHVPGMEGSASPAPGAPSAASIASPDALSDIAPVRTVRTMSFDH